MPPESTRPWPAARRPRREANHALHAAATMYCPLHAANGNGHPAEKKRVALMNVGAAVSAAREEADCDPEDVTHAVRLALDRRLHETRP